MFFHNKVILVFLQVLIYSHIIYSTHLYGINKTVFLFNHPINCTRSEIFSFENFSCSPCDPEYHLQPSFDKTSCLCAKSYETVALYDSHLKRPVCAKPCVNRRFGTCNPVLCGIYYINNTYPKSGSFLNIRILNFASDALNNCTCNKKYNYVYNNYCIWKDLFNNFLSSNVYWQRGKVFDDLQFVSFFCQKLNNHTSCNHLANLCIKSFFVSDKNSPCRLFFLSQVSDTNLYSSIGGEQLDIQPSLFYKRGKDTIRELEKQIKYSHENGKTSMELSTVVYSLEGEIIRWGRFKLSHIDLCNYRNEGPYSNIDFFKSFDFNCELSMDTIIEFANLLSNKEFFSIFLNYSLDGRWYMQTVPILVEDAFDGNMESNINEWQMIKRFQLISGQTLPSTLSLKTPKYDDTFKLHLYKRISVLRKFVFNCKVKGNNTISLPYITLSYYSLDITSNTSLRDLFKFELSVRFEKEQELSIMYKICLPFFLIMSLCISIIKSYTLKYRRYSDYCDIAIFMQFTLYFLSNIGNSFVFVVVMDALYSSLDILSNPQAVLIAQNQTLEISKLMIYIATVLKGLYFLISFWKTARVDLYFLDWERPKIYEAIHVKNNLDTSSLSSSIRASAEGNVSAWRTIFVAKEWIKLSKIQMTSSFVQCFSSLSLYWIVTRAYPSFNTDTNNRLVLCISIYSLVYAIQRIFGNIVLNNICGSQFKKFVDICTMTNVSVLILVEPYYGFYIHGRSPHGSADVDMHSIVVQLNREAQNMCAKRGLLDDSNYQTYIILPPFKLSEQIQKITHPNTKTENLSHVHFQTSSNIGKRPEGILDGSLLVYNRLNRFLCAFIDHAIKDMDYIIKEKSLIENILSCEFDSFLTENKGTFYIDNKITFSSLFPYGNQNSIFLMELVMLMTIELLTSSVTISVIIVCINVKIVFHTWVKNNIANKSLIDKRFLM